MSSNSNSELEPIRHTAEHILTLAMIRLFGTEKVIMAMGPATDDGFYFDFDHPDSFTISETEFPQIETEMRKIIQADLPLTQKILSVTEAQALFKTNPYKQAWLKDIEARGEPVSVYWLGDEFVDLCSGPHAPSTGAVKAFKLLSVAGAYWHGDEKNKMLTRLYGTAFSSQPELDQYLHQLEEAKKRDHRKLGKTLDLFTFSDLVGGGLPLYTPRGALIRRLVNDYVETVQAKLDFHQVWTPQLTKAELFKVSGHYDKYKDVMFRVHSNYSDEEFYLKPMNCPQHTQIYASRPRSYRDLPLRLTDFAMLYRDEKPGELSGLARVRSFSQDDCHIFCREDQVDAEIDQMLTMTKQIMQTFGFAYRYRLSVRDPKHPENYIGDPKQWDLVEKWAEKIMQRNKIDYFVGVGEAAFYAPKMDLMATDALGRDWQLSTVQIDYFMPERFNLKYTGSDGQDQRPVMLHRAIIGSPERFLMVLIEHFAGAFPLWLSPVQVVVLPIGEKHQTYAQSAVKTLKAADLRAELWDQAESLAKRIRHGEIQKIPYLLIVGDKEVEANTLALRVRGVGDRGVINLDQFVTQTKTLIDSRSLALDTI
ncbi:threonine--tRNA ligase [Microgenomates group bacterium RBG_16_45_19]|nr:MAG: threonine--tRNA ligase [Microgenomates group bacterium RBG_16_45_19]